MASHLKPGFTFHSKLCHPMVDSHDILAMHFHDEVIGQDPSNTLFSTQQHAQSSSSSQAKLSILTVLYEKNLVAMWNISKLQAPNITFSLRINNPILDFCYLPDHHAFATCSGDERISFFDKKWIFIKSIPSLKVALMIRYSKRHRKLFAFGQQDMMMWDIERMDLNAKRPPSTKLIETPMPKNDWIKAIHLDEEYGLVYVGFKFTILIFDMNLNKQSEILTKSTSYITCIQTYTHLRYVLVGMSDGSVKVWGINNTKVHELREHYKSVLDLRVYNKNGYLVSSSLDKTLRLWNIENFEQLHCIQLNFPPLSIHLLGNSTLLVRTEEEACLWSLEDITQPFIHTNFRPDYIWSTCHLDNKPQRVYCLTGDGVVRCISPSNHELLAMSLPVVEAESLADFTYSFETGKDCAYFMRKNSEIWVVPLHLSPSLMVDIWKNSEEYNEHCQCLLAVDFKDIYDGKEETFTFLLSGTTSGQVIIYDINGVVNRRFQVHNENVAYLAYLSEDRCLVSVSTGGSLKCSSINPHHAEMIQNFIGIQLEASPTLLSTLGSTICCCLVDGCVQMFQYDGSNHQLTPIIGHSRQQDHTDKVKAFCNIPSLSLFITAGNNNDIKIWDLNNVLIREIQLTSAILTLCPCTNKGDLLIGLSHSIDIISWKDYLPPKYWKIANSLQPELPEIEEDSCNMPKAWSELKLTHQKRSGYQGTELSGGNKLSLINQRRLLPSSKEYQSIPNLSKSTTHKLNEAQMEKKLKALISNNTKNPHNVMTSLSKEEKGKKSKESISTIKYDRELKNEATSKTQSLKLKSTDYSSTSIRDLRYIRNLNSEELFKKLMDIKKEHLSTAPDGCLPNSKYLPIVEEWLKRKNKCIERIKVGFHSKLPDKGKDQCNMGKLIPSTRQLQILNDIKDFSSEKKQSQIEFKKKLYDFLNDARRNIDKIPSTDEDVSETGSQEILTERGPYRRLKEPKKPKVVPDTQINDNIIPSHVLKFTDRHWFTKVERKIMKGNWRDMQMDGLDTSLGIGMKIEPTAENLVPILIDCFWDCKDFDKQDIFEYFVWFRQWIKPKERELLISTMFEYIQGHLDTILDTELVAKEAILKGVIRFFTPDIHETLVVLFHWLKFQNKGLREVAISCLQDLGFVSCDSNEFISNLEKFCLMVDQSARGLDPFSKEKMNEETSYIENFIDYNMRKRQDPRSYDAYERSELFREKYDAQELIQKPYLHIVKALEKWLQIVMRRYLIALVEKEIPESLPLLKNYNCRGEKNEKLVEGELSKKKKKKKKKHPSKGHLAEKSGEGEMTHRQHDIETFVKILKDPMLADFISAFEWFINQLKMYQREREDFRKEGLRLQEKRQERLLQIQEREQKQTELLIKRQQHNDKRIQMIQELKEKKALKKFNYDFNASFAERRMDHRAMTDVDLSHESRESELGDDKEKEEELLRRNPYLELDLKAMAKPQEGRNRPFPIEHVAPFPFDSSLSVAETIPFSFRKHQTFHSQPNLKQIKSHKKATKGPNIQVESFMSRRRYYIQPPPDSQVSKAAESS